MMLTQSAYGFTSSSTSMRMLPRQRASRAGAMRSPGICSLSAQDVSVTLQRPLGIVFEEVEPGQAEGVVVAKVCGVSSPADVHHRKPMCPSCNQHCLGRYFLCSAGGKSPTCRRLSLLDLSLRLSRAPMPRGTVASSSGTSCSLHPPLSWMTRMGWVSSTSIPVRNSLACEARVSERTSLMYNHPCKPPANHHSQALIGLGGGGPKTNWTRKMIPVGKATFQTIMGAIGSNTGRWGYTDVRLTLRRTANSVPRSTDTIKREGGRGAGEEKELPLATPRDEWAD